MTGSVSTFDPASLEQRTVELEEQMSAPGFWDEQNRAAAVSAEHARLSRRLEGYRGLRGLRSCGHTPDDTPGPGPQVGLELVPAHVPKDGMERGRTGGGMGEAEGLREACAIMASPFGHGTIAAIATQHGTTRQREYSA